MRIALLTLSVLLTACSERAAQVIDGPLPEDRAISLSDSGGERLATVGADGFRMLIAPSFGHYRYYLSLRRLPAGCVPRSRQRDDGADAGRGCGPALLNVRRIDQKVGQVRAATFFIPGEEAEALVEELDARLDQWRGTNARWSDGTGVALERVRNGRVRSMDTNQPAFDAPDNPAAQLKGDLHRILLAYGPGGFAPRSSDWQVRGAEPEDDPCNQPELATPLNQGFGVGDSDCDAARRWSD